MALRGSVFWGLAVLNYLWPFKKKHYIKSVCCMHSAKKPKIIYRECIAKCYLVLVVAAGVEGHFILPDL